MCEPVTMAVSAGLKVAGTIADHSERTKAANRQNAAWAQNRLSAIESGKTESAAAITGFSQFLAGASQKVNQVRREQQEAMSEATLSAAEAGIEGNSADILLMDAARAAEEAVVSVRENVENERTALTMRLREVAATVTNRTNSMSKGTKPSLLGTIIKVGDTMSSYADARAERSSGNSRSRA